MKRMYFGLDPSDTPKFGSETLLGLAASALVTGVAPSAGSTDMSVSARVSIAPLFRVVFTADGAVPRLTAGRALNSVSAFVESGIGSAI